MKNIHIFPKKFGFFPYIFLVYLLMPVLYISNEKGWKLFIGYTLLLLFLVSYRQLFCFPPVKIYVCWLAIQLAIIVILSLWYGPYNLFLGFFPSNFIGWFEHKILFKRALIAFSSVIIGTLILLFIQETHIETLSFLPFIAVMLISPFGIRSMNKRMELEKELDQANEKIKELVKREERVRIARDLHDTLGHTLSLITLQSQLIQRLVKKQPERAIAEAREMEGTSRSALRQVRELVSEMRALTIAEELIHMEQILHAAGIGFLQKGGTQFTHLPPLVQNIIAMCLREAGTNIVKHSKAQSCLVHFQEENGFFSVRVQDDGITATENIKVGNGLRGMKERLSLLNGQVEFKVEKGMTLDITVPLILKQEEMTL
ncbi:sensor histidine kinase [Bacillus sp. SD088]|uniref:sensor histidine kinase n=1 Tax=Bacillus sp. SD088 TaxID=2782012 RepID=UPI0028BE2396|nr:sensor histidine kinase [Bacillus sp. SD088]